MPDNMGMLAGVGQGLSSAVSTYLQTKQMMQENDVKKMLANAQTAEAVGGFLQKAGRKNLTRYGSQFGIQNPDAGTPGPGEPGSLAAQVQSQGPDQGASSGGGLKGPSEKEIEDATDRANDLPEGAGRQAIMKPVLEKAQSAAELQTPQGQQKHAAPLVDMYNRDPAISNARAASPYVRKLMQVDPKSPNASTAALIHLLNIIEPGHVATEGNLHTFQNNKDIPQRVQDLISKKLNGTLSNESLNDIKSLGAHEWQALRGQQQERDADFTNRAKSLSIDPSAFRDSTFQGTDNLIAKAMKGVGRYQSTAEKLAQTPGGKNIQNAAEDAGKGILNTAKNVLNNFSMDKSVADNQPAQMAVRDGYIYEKTKGGWKNTGRLAGGK